MTSSPHPPPGRPRPWQSGEVAVYHITHIGNLASMATDGELQCDRRCSTNGIEPVSIAYQDLKARRSDWRVRVARGGTLADYVPFYYAPRSPMLYAIAGGWVPGYGGGQVEVAHLVFSAGELARAGDFVVTDGHAATALSEQFDDFDGLDEIDWGIMREKYWRDTDEDGDRKRRRQAEFLVFGSVPFSGARQIGVMAETVAAGVRDALARVSDLPVVVRPDWYY